MGIWDGKRNRWVEADAFQIPFFMRRPRFTSLRTPATWLYWVFAIVVVAQLVALLLLAGAFALLEPPVSTTEFWEADDLVAGALILAGVPELLLIPLFIWWARRATCNVPALGATRPTFSPGWSVAWWFVPIANLFLPLRVLNQAWRASDPELPPTDNDGWRVKTIPLLLPAWWLFFVLTSILTRSGDRAYGAALDAEALSGAAQFLVWVFLARIAAGVLAIAVVASLTNRQDQANARFDLIAGLDGIPGSRAWTPTLGQRGSEP